MPWIHIILFAFVHLHSLRYYFIMQVHSNSYRYRHHTYSCNSIWNNCADNSKSSANGGISNALQSECESRSDSNNIRFRRIRWHAALFLPMACNCSRREHLYLFRSRFSMQLICHYYHLLFCYFDFYTYRYLWV